MNKLYHYCHVLYPYERAFTIDIHWLDVSCCFKESPYNMMKICSFHSGKHLAIIGRQTTKYTHMDQQHIIMHFQYDRLTFSQNSVFMGSETEGL